MNPEDLSPAEGGSPLETAFLFPGQLPSWAKAVDPSNVQDHSSGLACPFS